MLVKLSKSLLTSNAKCRVQNLLGSKDFHLAFCNKYSNEASNQSQTHQENKTTEQKPNEAADNQKVLEEKLSKCQEDVLEFKDKYLRAMAEAENVRVRMRKQIDDAKIFGIQGFCKDLLEVADILNLAITNTNPNKSSESSEQANVKEQLNAMHQGLVMTETRLLKIFEKHGLVQIKPKEGDKFDPNLHEAIFRVPIPNKQSGSIEMLSKIGFKLHERVIRAAQVGVVQ